jgi:HEAT repeat protein
MAKLIREGGDTRERLRALWAFHASFGLGELLDATILLKDNDEFVRSWTVQCLLEHKGASPGTLATEPDANDNWFHQKLPDELARLAREDKSPVVRRFIASALQRLKPEQRWVVLRELVQHAEDASDHNLPLMYWYAAEACVASDPDRALELLKACKIPKVREFIARRLATLSLTSAK